MKYPAHSAHAIRSLIEERLDQERLLIPRRSEAELSVPLYYPSPYHVAMSSLGYQVVYRLLNDPSYPDCAPSGRFCPTMCRGVAAAGAACHLRVADRGRAVPGDPVFQWRMSWSSPGLFSCLARRGERAAERARSRPAAGHLRRTADI